jgi:hypothetical protein
MIESSPLVAIIVGVGLAVLTSRDIMHARGDDGQTRRSTPLFVLAVQLIGLAIVGAALYIAAYSFEGNHKLALNDLKAENLFIATLVMMIVFLGLRNAWNSMWDAQGAMPWERGLLDRLHPLPGLATAILIVSLVGLLTDETLIKLSVQGGAVARLLLGTAVLAAALAVVMLVLRLLVGGPSSPRGFALSRKEQRHLLQALASKQGFFQMVRVTAVGALEPALSLEATIWITREGWYWRSEDGGALARYHKWAAHNARLPTPALHAQALTVWAGLVLRSRRGLRLTPIRTRWWWIDAWRSHRDQPAPAPDRSRPEYEAGLVFISHSELLAAGLTVVIEAASHSNVGQLHAGDPSSLSLEKAMNHPGNGSKTALAAASSRAFAAGQ